MSLRFACTLLVVVAGVPAAAHAAAKEPSWPTRPVRFVVPFPPGGTPDIQARILAEPLRDSLGQPVVIDNRGGANGVIAMELVARAPADGYTILIGTVGNWAVNPHLRKLPYDVVKDFAPIVHVATTPGVVVVNPAVPVKSIVDLIALARQKPGTLNYGSVGIGGFGHICTELFMSMTGTRMTHVPYKSSITALTDTVSGSLQVLFNSAPQTIPHIRSGRVRALATTGAKRAAALPDLPTVAEAGVPGYENSTWSAIGAPARTPPAVLERLNRDFNAILKMPDVVEKHALLASTVTGGSAEDFRAYLTSQLAKFGKLVKEAGIKGD